MKSEIDNDTSGDYDNWKRLIDEGASTFNARTDYTHTVTIPNHASMVTGRPVGGDPGTASCTIPDHCYTDNGTPDPSWTLHNHGNPNVSYIASVWDVAHDHGLSTACYASKPKFVIFDQSYDASAGAPDTTGADDGTDKIDTYDYDDSQHYNPPIVDAYDLHQDFLTDMPSQHFDYTFLHYTDPDKAGHASGWGSNDYNDSLKNVDGYLGDILDLVENDSVLAGKTVIIVLSDHGGTGYRPRHRDAPGQLHHPLLRLGPRRRGGSGLYDLNPGSRTDPGTGRPDYGAAGQPIRNGGSGNLALSLLGLPAIADSSINGEQDLRVAISSLAEIPVPAASAPARLLLGALILAAGTAFLARRRAGI